MRILITGVGGPTPRSFVNSLIKYSQYADYEFIGTDINFLAMGLYRKDLFKKTYIVPPASDKNYWLEIGKIVKDNDIDMAVILPELEVIEWSRKKEIDALPCKVLLPDHALAELLVDKAKMTDLLEELDVVPKSIEFSRDEHDLKKISNYLGFPFWVRSTSGSSGLGSLKIQDENSLKNWIHINPKVHQFLASKFLPGRNLACKLLYYEGNLVRAAVAERINYIMSKVSPSGITGNTSYGRLLNEPKIVSEAVRAMNFLFKQADAEKHGFFTADFKEDEDGKPYITEINVRHVAFTQCFAAGGANFAEDTIRLLDSDSRYDKSFLEYEFKKGLIFLRDVDELPVIMNEKDLLNF